MPPPSAVRRDGSAEPLEGPAAGSGETRGERKERTRRALMAAALDLCEDSSLVALSLRQVAKQVGIVPTAFYRHYDSLEDLGLALVEESFASLREMLRDTRRSDPELSDIIDRSVSVVLHHSRERRAHFAFISREWRAGPPAVRQSIQRQIELVESELAVDLARIVPATWSTEDLRVLSNLIVNMMVAITESLVAAQPVDEEELAHRARTQLRMLLVGGLRWRSGES